ncbi:MAG TPA: tetratricopeptide repeat protein [Opitutaceae bacterium]|nr:tetratricopeptide repeat protein [Opitutaceae bacterium]
MASGIVVLAALAAYHNSFSGPFIFDDKSTITDNPTIRHLGSALFPADGTSASGRPMLNLTFAFNYALNGTEVWGYHAFNLLVHTLAGLVLFGIMRRTLLQPALRGRFGMDATPLALAMATIWVVHPLQTESVTYIVQRAESLMGLFYLLTLYCFIRSTDETGERQQARGERTECESLPNSAFSFQPSPSRRSFSEGGSSGLWLSASILCCLLGMASKEVMVSAPLIVLLYDRTFVAGTFLEAWRRRWQFYGGLASTWLLLGGLVASTHGRGGSAGVAWWAYALTQFHAIIHYLQLSLWPSPLVLDYGVALAKRAMDIVPYAAVLLLLAIGTVFAVWRRPVIGFFAVWFFAILAPSSSIVAIGTQTMAEHRMYLALAPVVVLAVLGFYLLLGRRSVVIFLALVVGLGWLSVQRNKDYRSELAIWSDTVAKCTDNERAHVSLGTAYSHVPGHWSDEIAEYQAALRIKPEYAEAHNNLGNALLQVPGRLPDAVAEYKIALRINPGYAEAHINLGNALLRMPGHVPEVLAEYKSALRINPKLADAYYDAGCVLSQIPGRLPDAIAAYQAALRINPDQSEAHYNLGCALLQIRARLPEAIAEFEAALQINPGYADAHVNLGYALLQVPGHGPEAMAHFETALQIRPDLKEVRQELARLRAHP